MTETQLCPECGAELQGDSPEGLCPKCLLQRGLSGSGHDAALRETPTTGPVGPFTAPSPADLAGRFPHLEILEFLGQGGMGAVYKARQTKLDRLVAVKVLPPEWGRDPAFAERFAREARALAKLNHPQIVTVYDFGEAGGLFYLVMEFVDGVNLRQLLEARKLQPDEALKIVPQICDALQYAHEEGIVHRDIKPENILLDKKGRVKIADFGLAKLLSRPRAYITLTGSHQVMGTLDYMAPEQRHKPLEVDHRADIYSLGVVFYEMLTGQLPLGRFAPPSHKATVDARLDDVVFRALEREPARRYQQVSEVKRDIEGLASEGRPVRAEASTSGAAASVPISVPCKWSSQSLSSDVITTLHCHGILMFDGTALTLEIEVQEVEVDLRAKGSNIKQKKSLRETHFALGNLQAVRLHHGWLGTSLTLQVSRLSVLAEVPGGSYGELQVKIARKDREAAERLVDAVSRRLSGDPIAGSAVPVKGPANPRDGNQGEIDREKALLAVKKPASVLFALGLLAILPGLAFILQWVLAVTDIARIGRDPDDGWQLFLIPVQLIYAIVVLGALKMYRLQSHGWAVTGAILAMVPVSPFVAWGLPVGIWALLVLRKPEVKAAFGLYQRRRLSGPGIALQPPTRPVAGRVRSFLRSLRSQFLSGPARMETSLPSQPPVAEDMPRPSLENLARQDRDIADVLPASPERKRRVGVTPAKGMTTRTLLWLGVGVAGILAFALFVSFAVYENMSSKSSVTKRANPEPPVLDAKLAEELHLDAKQVQAVNHILEVFFEEYQRLESSNIEYHNEPPYDSKHKKVTIRRFIERQELEKRFWSRLDTILNNEQLAQAQTSLQLDGFLFVYGKTETTIEIWLVEKTYHWKITKKPGPGLEKEVVQRGNGPQLPKECRRFWW